MGWYWVLGIFLILTFILILRSTLRLQRNRYRREALAELAIQESALTDGGRRAEAISAMAELLKRATLTAFPREQVASLTGPAWFTFLDRTGRTTAFSAGSGATLERATYDQRVADTLTDKQLREIITAVRQWLKNH